MLYVNLSTANGHNWSSVVNGNYGLWMARWDYDRNADAPATQWPFTAMRQYSNHEHPAGVPSTNVDGDVFYGDLATLKSYGPSSGVVGTTSIWATLPTPNRWYRSDEHMVYHINGDRPNTVHELIDGSLIGEHDTSDGFIAFSYGPQGMHSYNVESWNSGNSANHSFSGQFTAGYDTNAPVTVRTSGALPGSWYGPGQIVEFKSTDEGSGLKAIHYRWDSGAFSDWTTGTDSMSVPLTAGKHHLYVEAEDNAYMGSTALGNRSITDLGEFWLDTALPSVQVTATLVNSGSSIQIEVTVTNSNNSTATAIGVDLIQLGVAKGSPSSVWDISSIPGNSSVKKTFTFQTSFGANKSLLFTSNYHIGTTKYRIKRRIQRPQ